MHFFALCVSRCISIIDDFSKQENSETSIFVRQFCNIKDSINKINIDKVSILLPSELEEKLPDLEIHNNTLAPHALDACISVIYLTEFFTSGNDADLEAGIKCPIDIIDNFVLSNINDAELLFEIERMSAVMLHPIMQKELERRLRDFRSVSRHCVDGNVDADHLYKKREFERLLWRDL